MLNSKRFLLILIILSKTYDSPLPLDLIVFLHLYFLKDANDLGLFSFYHKEKSTS